MLRRASLVLASAALMVAGWTAYRAEEEGARRLVSHLESWSPSDSGKGGPRLVVALQSEDCRRVVQAIRHLNRIRLGRGGVDSAVAHAVTGLVLDAPAGERAREDIRLVSGAEFPLVFLSPAEDDWLVRQMRTLGWPATPFLIGYHDDRVRFVAPLISLDSLGLATLMRTLLL